MFKHLETAQWCRVPPWISAVVEADTGHALSVVDGLSSANVTRWLRQRSPAWLDRLQVVANDPSSALRNANPFRQFFKGLKGDERNTLLTLARSLVTPDSGRIVPKDVAVDVVEPMLAEPDRALLEHAQAKHLGLENDDWGQLAGEAAALTGTLANMAEQVIAAEALAQR